MSNTNETSAGKPKQIRNAFRFSLVMAITMTGLAIVSLFIGGLPKTWLDLTTLLVLVAITSVISTLLSRRGQHVPGVMALIASLLFACVATAIQFSGFGAVLATVAMIISFGVGMSSLPRRYANIVNIVSILLTLGFILLDIFEPFPREPNTLPTITWIITGGLAVVFGFGILRNFGEYNFRTKLIISFIFMAVITLGIMTVFAQNTTTNLLTENLGRELSETATGRALRISSLLREQTNLLSVLGSNDIILDTIRQQTVNYPNNPDDIQAQIEEADRLWRIADEADNNAFPLVSEQLTHPAAQVMRRFQYNFPDNAEVFATDKYGALIGATGRTSDYYQGDEEWWQTAYNNGAGAVYISDPEFDESVGQMVVLIAIPVLDEITNTVIGVIRTTHLMSAITSILDEPIGETGEADLLIPGDYPAGYPLYIRGGSLEPVEASIYEELIAVGDQPYVKMVYEYDDSFVSQATVTTEGEIDAINDLGWFVVVSQHSNEALAPIQAQTSTALGLVIVVVAIAAAVAIGLSQVLVTPISRLTNTAQEIAGGNFSVQAEITTQDEVGILAQTFNTMTAQLRNILAGLEERIVARTRDLELAAEVGRRLSLVSDTASMLTASVDVIRERFELYYTQVYLTDPTGRALVLQAGTGEVGQTLLRRGHRLPLDMGSLNGIAATERQTVVVEDTETSAIHRPNPLLPETRSEMTIPLIVSDQVVGVLDMQSSQPGALSQENQAAFEALAAQLAIAIANAELFEEAEQARQAMEEQSRRLVSSGWQDFLNAIERSERFAFHFDRQDVTPLSEPLPDATDESALIAPVRVSGASIGKLQFQRERAWTEDEHAIVNSVALQMAQQIENLRLLAQAEQYRSEAQEALRRLTREGWEEYLEQIKIAQHGFSYSDFEVKPLAETAVKPAAPQSYPIQVRDETIGQLDILGDEALPEDDIELVNYVNEQLGIHLESLRLSAQTEQALAETEDQATRLAALNELSEQLTNAETLAEILNTTSRYMSQIIDAARTSITWATDDNNALEVFALQGEAGAIPTGSKLPVEGSAVGAAFSERRVVIVPDLTQSDYLENARLVEQGLRASMAVPLLTTDRTLGTLNFGSQHSNAFGNRERDLALQAASLISNIIENRELFQQTQLRAQREQSLRQIATRVRTFVESDMILQTTARELGEALGRKVVVNLGKPAADNSTPGNIASSDDQE